MGTAGLRRIVAAFMLSAYLLTGIVSPSQFSILNSQFSIPAAEAATGINPIIHYQGKISLLAGSAVGNGIYNMRFKIYDAASAGTLLWSENWTNATTRVTMTGGLFSVGLGTHVTMTGSVNFNTDNLYLQVEFDPGNDGTYEEVFAPRRRFASVPYAHNTDTIDGIDSTTFLRKDAVNVMTGSIISSGTLSGAVIHASNSLTTSGALTVKGAVQLKNYTTCALIKTDTNGNLGCGSASLTGSVIAISDPRYVNIGGDTMTGALTINVTGGNRSTIGLNIVNTASGAVFHAEKTLSSSGTLVWEGAGSGSSLYIASSLQGAGLTDCDIAGTSKLLWDATTGRFACGSDQTGGGSSFGTGNVLTISDSRYVNTSGDTMTGALTINVTSGTINTIGLKVINTLSGAILQATQQLRSSGSLVTESGAVFDGGTLYVNAMNNRVGIGTTAPADIFTIRSTAPLVNLQNSVTSREWKLRNGGIINGSTTFDIYDATAAESRFLIDEFGNVAMGTGSTGINSRLFVWGGPTGANVDVRGDASIVGGDQATIELEGNDYDITPNSVKLQYYGSNGLGTTMGFANNKLGVLSWGGVSTALIQVTDNKPLIIGTNDTERMRISESGSVAIGTTTPGSRLSVSGAVIINPNGNLGSAAADAGLALEIIGTASGRIIKAMNTLASSGTLVFEGAGSGSSLYIASSLQGVGLTDCDIAGSSKLLWDASTGRFSCGSDQTGGVSSFGTGNVLTISDSRYVNVSGDTMTGALTINLASGYIGLRVIQTASGSVFHAEKSLTSSGQIIVRQSGVSQGSGALTVTNTTRYGTGAYMAASGAILVLDSVGGRAGSTLSPHILFGYQGNFDTVLSRRSAGVLETKGTFSGALITQNGAGNNYFLGSVGIGTISPSELLVIGNDIGNMTSNNAAVIGASGTSNTELFLGNNTNDYGKILWDGGNKNMHFGVSEAGALSTNQLVLQGGDGRVGIGTATPKATLGVAGTISGSSLVINSSIEGAGLTDCDIAGSSKLLWDATTGRFSCGTDQTGGSGSNWSNTGSLMGAFDTRYVNVSGDTMTGALTINLTSGYIGLRVIQTASGSIFHAEKALTSSGQIIVRQSGVSQGSGALTVTNTTRYGTGAYMAASGAILVLDSVGGTIGGSLSPHILFGYKGTFDTSLSRRSAGVLETKGTFSGALITQNGAGSNYFMGRVGIGTASPLGLLHVGDASNLNSTSPGVLVSRSISNATGAGNAHGLADNSVISRTGPIGYNSFDARVNITTQGNMDHYNSFQAYPNYASTGTITALGGYISDPTIDAGTVTSISHFSASDAEGAGTINNQYGFITGFMDNATNNYAIYTTGTTKSYFGGNVGIGTTSPEEQLNVFGTNAAIMSEGDGITKAGFKIKTNNSLRWDINAPSGQTYLTFQDSGSDDVLVLTQGNNVGIGTTAPKAKLDVLGTISGSLITQNGAGDNYFRGDVAIGTGSAVGQLDIYKASNATMYLRSNASTLRFINSSGNNYIQSGTGYLANEKAPLIFTSMNNGNEWMRISATGSLGIGTNSPGSRLSVSGAVVISNRGNLSGNAAKATLDVKGTISGSLITQNGAGTNTFAGATTFSNTVTNQKDGGNALNYLDSYNSTDASTTALTILRRARGSLASPTAVLAGDWLGALGATGHNGTSMLTANRSIVGFLTAENWNATRNGTNMVFYNTPTGSTTATERMRLTSTGSLGIGTTTPSEKLDIYNGNLRLSSGSILATPIAPTVAGSITDATNFDQAIGVAVQGRYAYLTSSLADTFSIIDIAVPTAPIRISTIGGVGDADLDNAFDVAVNGNYAYVTAANVDKLTVIDISNPTSPVVVGSVSSSTQLDTATAIAIAGKYAYVTASTDDRITAVDISDPTAPVIVGSSAVDSTDTNYPYDIKIQGKYAYVAVRLDSGELSSGARLTIFDVSNPANITKVSTVTNAALNDARSVYVSGRYAYVTGYVSDSVVIVDISNPASPSVVGSVTHATRLNLPSDVIVAGKYAYVTGTSYVTVLDVSNPASPAIVGYTADATNLNTSIRMAMAGRYLYVAASGTDRFTVMDTGNELPTLYAGALGASILNVEDTATVGQDARIGGNLNVGGLTMLSNDLQVKDTLYVKTASGFVGINTTAPKTALEVLGTISGSLLTVSAVGTNYLMGNVAVGTTTPNIHGYANAGGLLTIQNTAGTTLHGVLELANRTDADEQPIGDLAFTASSQTSAVSKRSALIRASLAGATANNRGSALLFFTRANGGSNDIAERMRIDEDGNVGIGTTNPSTSLHITDASAEAMRIEGSSTNSWLQFNEGATVRGYIGYGDNGDLFTGAGKDSLSLRAQGPLHLGANGNSLIMTLTGSKVGIGKALPKSLLDVQGTMSGKTLFLSNMANVGATQSAVCVTSTGAVLKNGGTSTCLVSSLRFKHDVQDLPDSALATLARMRPVSYTDNDTGIENLGLIAEEVEQIDPRLVFYEADGTTVRGVKYENFTALLAKGIQELNARTSGVTANSGTTISSPTGNGTASLLTLTSNVSSTGNTVLRVNASGSVFTDGTYNSSGADYAEWFTSKDTLKQGEVVCIDITRSNAVERCKGDADSNVMGIVSTNPAFIGNSIGGASGIIPPGYALIGLIGQVPAKVIVEGEAGAIRPGDSLTASSIPGYARKAQAGESTVGVALEGLESGEGVVNVLISRRNSSMTVDAVGDKVLQTIADMKIEDEVELMVSAALGDLNVDDQITAEVTRQIDVITAQNASIEAITLEISRMKEEIASLKVQSGSVVSHESRVMSDSQLHASAIEIDDTLVTGGDARIGGDLSIDGTLNASSLFVPNGLTIDGGVVMNGLLAAQRLHVVEEATVDGMLTINGTLNLASGATLNMGSGALHISDLIVDKALFVMGDVTIKGLATFLGNVDIQGELTVSSKQAGFAKIPKSGTSVTVSFGTGFISHPVITAAPQNRVGSEWWIDNTTATGFTIHIDLPASTDVTFSWIALGSIHPFVTQAPVQEDGTIIFPLDTKNIPVSSNMAWNACIRNITLLDSDGQPLSCARYHDAYTWTHPDLQIDFIWNTSVTPALLKLPDGYEARVTEDAADVEAAFGTREDGEDVEEIEGIEEETGADTTMPAEDEMIPEEPAAPTDPVVAPVEQPTEEPAAPTEETPAEPTPPTEPSVEEIPDEAPAAEPQA